MENSGKMIVILILGVAIFVGVSAYYSIGPFKAVAIEEMEVYPDAEEIENTSDIMEPSFLLADMKLNSTQFASLLALEDIKVYGVFVSEHEVYSWYWAMNNVTGWHVNNSWRDG